MLRLFAKLRGRNPDPSAVASETPPERVGAGQVYSFRTRPYSEFAPAETGRYAAIKVLGADDNAVAAAALEGIWSEPPSSEDVRACRILEMHHHKHNGGRAIVRVNQDFWQADDLDELQFVATFKLSASERRLAADTLAGGVGVTHSALRFADFAAEGEWRWANDRAAFEAELEQKRAKVMAERAAKQERDRTRLKGLTWDKLRSETPFKRWSPSPPFPPAEFTQAARKKIAETRDALEALGPKPRRPAVRKILKETVLWFNRADEEAGHVIETEEREDIFAVLEELCHVAKQKALIAEIDQWREW